MEQSLLRVIRERMPGLSKGQRRIADYILLHYDEAAYMNAASLGAAADVSESTVVRFAMSLGYKGYPEFLAGLAEFVKSRLTAIQRVGVAETTFGGEDIVRRVLSLDAGCVQKSVGLVDRADFDAAVRGIVSAKDIYIAGTRSSAALAVFLQCYLAMMFKNVHLITGASAGGMLEEIRAAGREDIVVGVSFPRYSRRTVQALEYAKKRGAKVLAITDSPLSPLVPLADYKLLAGCEIISFVDSLVSPLSVINALLLAVGMERKKELRAALLELEEIWEEYGVYDKGAGESAGEPL